MDPGNLAAHREAHLLRHALIAHPRGFHNVVGAVDDEPDDLQERAVLRTVDAALVDCALHVGGVVRLEEDPSPLNGVGFDFILRSSGSPIGVPLGPPLCG